MLFLLTDSRFAKSPRSGSGTSGKTVLGINQKSWLKSAARGKDLDLIVWASSIPWIGADDAGEDYWAGYATERAELSQHLVDNDIRNVCMISGDAHMVAIDDGRHADTPPVDAVASPSFRLPRSRAPSQRKAGPIRWGTRRKPGPGIAGTGSSASSRLTTAAARTSGQLDRLSRRERHHGGDTAASTRIPGSPDLRRLLTGALASRSIPALLHRAVTRMIE